MTMSALPGIEMAELRGYIAASCCTRSVSGIGAEVFKTDMHKRRLVACLTTPEAREIHSCGAVT